MVRSGSACHIVAGLPSGDGGVDLNERASCLLDRVFCQVTVTVVMLSVGAVLCAMAHGGVEWSRTRLRHETGFGQPMGLVMALEAIREA